MSESRTTVRLESRTKDAALRELAGLFGEEVRGGSSVGEITTILGEREALASTGVGSGVAIPHARVPALEASLGALAVSRDGVDFESLDGEPVFVFVCILTPSHGGASGATAHLRALARVSHVLKQSRVRQAIRMAGTPKEALDVLLAAEDEN